MDQVQRRRIREGLIPFQTRKIKSPSGISGGDFHMRQTFATFRVSDMTLSFHDTTSLIASFCCAVMNDSIKAKSGAPLRLIGRKTMFSFTRFQTAFNSREYLS
ncbi:MAG TPA: hypothetical protein DCX19_04600 [Alphaproteobacteria bacterium]|nr:hypothetical protein [Alphaproteobacteria bacterium]